MSAYILPVFVLSIVVYGLVRRTDIYDAFVEGAAEGLKTAWRVFPYIAAMLIAVSVMRAGGCFDALSKLLAPAMRLIGVPQETLALILIRPFSGSAALSMLADIYARHGPDSYAGLYASTVMGSTETLFYTATLYFGAVGVTKWRHTVPAALLACLAGVVASGVVCSLMFR